MLSKKHQAEHVRKVELNVQAFLQAQAAAESAEAQHDNSPYVATTSAKERGKDGSRKEDATILRNVPSAQATDDEHKLAAKAGDLP